MEQRNRIATFILAIVALIALTAGYRATAMPVTLVIDGVASDVNTHQLSVEMLLSDLGVSLRLEDIVSPDLSTSLSSGLEVHIARARPVVFVVDGRERTVYAHQENPADLLGQLNIELGSHDTLSVQPPTVVDPLDTRFRVVVERAVQVVLEEGGVRTTFYSGAATVGDALFRAGIRLYRADQVHPDLATPLLHGMHISLDRSVPVSLRVDGHVLRTRTHRARVGEVLADLGVTLNGQDYTTPDLDASLVEDAQIRVYRITESVIVEQSPIPFESVWQPDPNSEIDTQGLLQEGQPGVLERRIRLRYEDGQVADRYVEGESVVLAPADRVMGYGTKIIVRELATASGTIQYWRVISMLATSYSANTAGTPRTSPSYGRTATGMIMRHGIVAVDPNVIPLRSNVYVPGYGVGIAGDTGGVIHGRRIDLGYDDDNLELWYSWVDVYLLAPVPNTINYLGP